MRWWGWIFVLEGVLAILISVYQRNEDRPR